MFGIFRPDETLPQIRLLFLYICQDKNFSCWLLAIYNSK